jgi:rubrerythrin
MVRSVEERADTVMDRCELVPGSKRLPCDVCGHPMEPEHAHYRCPSCGYILPCCGW